MKAGTRYVSVDTTTGQFSGYDWGIGEAVTGVAVRRLRRFSQIRKIGTRNALFVPAFLVS